MELKARIINIRPFGQQKAVDVVWHSTDGAVLRDDGAKEVPDQIDVPYLATDDDIAAAIEKKRQDLTWALAQPGVGITLLPESETADFNQALIGKEF